jgi:ubiquinone/menaquinone biosynthesis C-methylase UbiE
MLTPQQWHTQFSRQASWTQAIRRYLYEKMAFSSESRLLEVGCGTGAITADLRSTTSARTFGLDLRHDFLVFAAQHDPVTRFSTGDVFSLPFVPHTFNATFCHYFLLWIQHPLQALLEMRRVVQPGGWVVALAEPDHTGRIDYPLELIELGHLQTQSLQRQGADPTIGRRVADLFVETGLKNIEVGLMGGQWAINPAATQGGSSEWSMLTLDLSDQVPAETLAAYRSIDETAWRAGSRILFIPTFYAIGQVP